MRISAGRIRIAIAAGLLLPAWIAAQPAKKPTSIFDALAGPGEKLVLNTGARKDGTAGSVKTTSNPDGTLKRFEADGRVELESPRINLKADKVVYDAESGILTGDGNVQIDQDGIKASSQRLAYTVATGEIRLTGKPEVTQSAPNGKTRFTGMNEFLLTRKESGELTVNLQGGKEIQCEMLPPDTPTPTPTPGAKQGAAAAGQGLGAFGSNVRISSRPKGSEPPKMHVESKDDGALGLFRAEGSVLLQSDTMNLRADTLEFNGERQLVEALYNVYIKQADLDADCGRMLYDLAKDKITLSVNPNVRQRREGGVTNIKDIDAFVITKFPDGTYTTDMVRGPGGASKLVYEGATPVPTPTPSRSKEPVEIDPNRPEDVNKISP